MRKPLIIVTGKNGQLGWELQQLSAAHAQFYDFLFTGREELDLSKPGSITAFFEKHQPAYFINCAAYTAVDKAETEQGQAYAINADAPGIIARACEAYNCTLITISTDYVFNGQSHRPYTTNAPTDPVNYYGYTKWMGEQLALQNHAQTVVIRTSWVYSSHGHNFVKTMLRLMKEKTSLNVVNDQLGSPTYAADLAAVILQVIGQLQGGERYYGIYHYSNDGIISWYDFAVAIRDMAGLHCELLPIPTTAYPTPARRPAYSGLDKSAIVRDFGVVLREWKESLAMALKQL